MVAPRATALAFTHDCVSQVSTTIHSTQFVFSSGDPHARLLSRPTVSWHRIPVWLRGTASGVAFLLLSSCSLPGAQSGGSSAEADFPVLDAAGVKGCSKLPARGPGEADDGLPERTLRCLTQDTDVDLSKIGGTPTIINLWASWCGPCREEMPLLTKTYQEVGDTVTFIGVNIRDNPPGALSLLENSSTTYPQIVDPEGFLLADLGVPGLPVTLALGSSGEIVDRQIGPVDADRLDEMVEAATAP